MAELSLRFDGSGNHIKFEQTVALLGDRRKAHAAFRRGVNHTGDKARTQVVRTLSKQMGLTQARLRGLNAINARRADGDQLAYVIRGSGRALSLREFGARQFSYGVRATPWGRAQRFEGAFVFAGTFRSGKFVSGGHVFRRTSGDSLPIERMFGPAVPTEMVRGETAEAFEATAGELGRRINHEVRRLTGGVVS